MFRKQIVFKIYIFLFCFIFTMLTHCNKNERAYNSSISDKNKIDNISLKKLNEQLIIQCDRGGISEVKELLQNGAEIKSVDSLGCNGLYYACNNYRDSSNLIALIISKGADVNLQCGSFNFSPLHLSVYFDAPKKVEILLKNGADQSLRDKLGRTPLALIAYAEPHTYPKHDNEIANLLIEYGANVNDTIGDGRTIIQYAYDEGEHNFIKTLIEFGADITEKGGRVESLYNILSKKKNISNWDLREEVNRIKKSLK